MDANENVFDAIALCSTEKSCDIEMEMDGLVLALENFAIVMTRGPRPGQFWGD